MARIFVSHTSKDDEFAHRLATDLKALTHDVFLDEWTIKVGDSITQKVSQGLAAADYIVVVLTPESVESGWVQREWQARYHEEIQGSHSIILPVLVKTCAIPPLLRDKKYADFRQNYSVALVNLADAIKSVIEYSQPPSVVPKAIDPGITDLLGGLHDPRKKLSQCLTESLVVARNLGDAELETFARRELSGWKVEEIPPGSRSELPSYRVVEAFVSPFGELNTQHYGFRGNAGLMFDHMRQDKEQFFPYALFVRESVGELESQPTHDPSSTIVTIRSTTREVLADPEAMDTPAWVYAKGDIHLDVLTGIRTELTRRLLDLLPRIASDN